MNFEHTSEDDDPRLAFPGDQALDSSSTGTSALSSIEPDRTQLAHSDEELLEEEGEVEHESGRRSESDIADEQEEHISETSSTEEYIERPRGSAREQLSSPPEESVSDPDEYIPPFQFDESEWGIGEGPDLETNVDQWDFLQNVAITVSDDHTGDGLLAERLLVAAQDKAAGNKLPTDTNVFVDVDTPPPILPDDLPSNLARQLNPILNSAINNILHVPGFIEPFGADIIEDPLVIAPGVLNATFSKFSERSPRRDRYLRRDLDYSSEDSRPGDLRIKSTSRETAVTPESSLNPTMFEFSGPHPPKDPRRIRRMRDKTGPVVGEMPPHFRDPTHNSSNMLNLKDDGESSTRMNASASTEIKGSEAPAPNQLENHQALVTDLKRLQEHIVHLQAQARQLENVQQNQEPFKIQVLYRIRRGGRLSGPYLDQPRSDSAEGTWSTLYSQSPVKNLELYMERHKEISLIVYRDFDDSNNKDFENQETAESESLPPRLKHYREVLRPVSSDMFHALRTILLSKPEYAEILKGFTTTSEVSSPFLFFFHSLKHLKDIETQMSDPVRRQLKLLANYVLGVYGAEYKTADAMIAEGRFKADFLCYFFKPNDIIVYQERDSIKGYVCDSWLGQPRIQKSSKQSQISLKGKSTTTGGAGESPVENAKTYTWDISVWSWSYDGHFYREKTKLHVEVLQGKREEQSVNCINVYPLQFAETALKERLRRRGETFWKCRFCRPMSYFEDASSDRLSTHGERYMVDMKTYQKIHASNFALKSAMSEFKMTEEEMDADDPPDEQFKYVVPLMMKGFNLRRKKWLDLKVDQISDVQWNKTAFKSLVVESRTKDLIQALVSKQLSIERSTDLIEDKGNGLILLLHGGPGTGKTLTAESVAEIAEKPLYRVTCGDIGIKAEDVEKYLESVLHLGKIWGCVVLLDEADVFLEQRTLEDLARNALVSVFLRVLEYYDGILVLTSNRVGTFDEAFKSRIQLALHYADLEEYQRQQIWNNFINRLEGLEEDVDLSDLRDNVQRLAKDEMNGRQIRNAITTARQFAEWKGEKLTYKHLEYVIEVSGRFEKYLDKLNGGMTQNELAREDRIR